MTSLSMWKLLYLMLCIAKCGGPQDSFLFSSGIKEIKTLLNLSFFQSLPLIVFSKLTLTFTFRFRVN